MQNQLIRGDALTILPTLPVGSFDALITDPPYASGGLTTTARQRPPSEKYCGKGIHADFVGEERDQRAHLKWMVMWLSACMPLLREGAPVCLFTDWRQLPLTTDALQVAGYTWRGIAVWDKTQGVRPQKGRFRSQAEYIVWGSKGALPIDRNVPTLPGVFCEPVRRTDKHHLTGKPTNLMRQLVRICEPGGRILDPFAGSGTTLLAAQSEGYSWLGCEMSQHYADVAAARLNA